MFLGVIMGKIIAGYKYSSYGYHYLRVILKLLKSFLIVRLERYFLKSKTVFIFTKNKYGFTFLIS